MSYTQDINDDVVFTQLRAFILDALGIAIQSDSVIRIPTNRTAMPKTFPYITMFPVSKEQIAWPVATVSDPSTQPQTAYLRSSTLYDIQVDAHGTGGADALQILFVLFQASNAFEFFAEQTPHGVYPIQVSAPHQAPLVDGEAQYEVRWIMDVHLQYNPTLSSTTQTMDEVTVGVINVEATYGGPGDIDSFHDALGAVAAGSVHRFGDYFPPVTDVLDSFLDTLGSVANSGPARFEDSSITVVSAGGPVQRFGDVAAPGGGGSGDLFRFLDNVA